MTVRAENDIQSTTTTLGQDNDPERHNGMTKDARSGRTDQPLKPPASQHNGSLSPIDTSLLPTFVTHRASPSSAELRVNTDVWPIAHKHVGPSPLGHRPTLSQEMESKQYLPVRSSSVKSLHYKAGSLSPDPAMSSPNLGPLSLITPLPSPVGQSSSPWSRSRISGEITRSEQSSPEKTQFPTSTPLKKRRGLFDKVPITVSSQESELSAPVAQTRNRSFSEYVAAAGQIPRTRNVAVSGSQTPTMVEPPAQSMQREEYLAVQRGISNLPTPRLPTPSASDTSETYESEDQRSATGTQSLGAPIFDAPLLISGKTKHWIALRLLGTGSFSRVMLATSDMSKAGFSEEQQNPKTLVAVKVCEHGPAGGADEKRIEESLHREIEILKAISHPSLVHLLAVNILPKRAYLVLSYCPGGDMFELASEKLALLTPSLVRRIFAELVAAVRYLHNKEIVHRDIKLENVLVNLRLSTELCTKTDWQTYPHPVVTLTDLGLGRVLPPPPASQLLTTRCGSEDYAAPELLMGQEYDGRMTDAWALGVLLYAIVEGRLPFDPIPGARRQSPTTHRIARCEWSWLKYADSDGEWDEQKGSGLAGARECVEGLLRRTRTRLTLDQIAEKDWVRHGIEVDGGLNVPDHQ